jgi:hypothetical protein
MRVLKWFTIAFLGKGVNAMTKTVMGSPLRESSRPAIDHTRDLALG